MSELSIITDPKSVFDNSEPKYMFRKPDLKPGEKKYYEIQAVQVDADYIAEHGDKVVTKEQPEGQKVKIGDWVVTKIDGDTTQQWTLYDETSPEAKAGMAFFQMRWMPVDGKPGYYSPRSVPTPMVELPEGGKVAVSWGGFAEGGAGSFLAKYGEGDYNVITPADLAATYLGADDTSSSKLEEVAASLK